MPSVVPSYGRVGTLDIPGCLVEELSMMSATIHLTTIDVERNSSYVSRHRMLDYKG